MATYKNDILFTEHLKGAFQGASDGSSGGSSDNSSDFPYIRVVRGALSKMGYYKSLKNLVLLTPLEIPCIKFYPIDYTDGVDTAYGHYPVDMALMELTQGLADYEVESVILSAYKKGNDLLSNHRGAGDMAQEPYHRMPFFSPAQSGPFTAFESVLLMNEQIGRDIFRSNSSYTLTNTQNLHPFFCLYTPEINHDKYVEVLEDYMISIA